MLSQNFKGLLTLVFIFSFLVGGFYVYKNVLEPTLIVKNDAEQFPITTDVEVNPKIEIQSNKAIVSFETPFESISAVQYCLKAQTKDCKETGTSDKIKTHKIEILNLTPETEYVYKILIDDTYYPGGDDAYFNFTTKKVAITVVPTTSGAKSTLIKETAPATTPTVKKMTLIEFKVAMQKQDLKYDTDKDGKITTKDYNP